MCVCVCVCVFRAALLVIFLECVWQKRSDTHKTEAAWDSPNPLMMLNDTYQWRNTHMHAHDAHTHTHTLSNPSRSSSTLPTVELQTGDNQVSPQVLGDWGVHKHFCCSFVLLPAVKQQGAPVEPTQASWCVGSPLGAPSLSLCGGRHTHTHTPSLGY